MSAMPIDDDLEPLVVVNDVDFARLPAVTTGTELSSAAQDFLRKQGIAAEATWDAFRLDRIDAAELERLGLVGRRRPPVNGGFCIPTWMPDDPIRPDGVIRLTYAQTKIRWVTPPQGLAGPVDLVAGQRIVITDTPILAMFLHQAGVPDVALAFDPAAVLPPLAPWLANREIILVAHRAPELAELRTSLGSQGAAVPGLLVATHRVLSDEHREVLGLPPAPPVAPPPLVTPRLLHDLVSYAQGRLDAGEAQTALDLYGAAIPDLIRSYRIGYLPADYRRALSTSAQHMLLGRRCGNALILPAFDDTRRVADVLILNAHRTSLSIEGMWAEPQGMLAPEIAHGHATITVTNSFRWLVRLFAQGHRDVLFLRGVVDAQHNAGRLVAAGVQHVVVRAWREGQAIGAALAAVGLRITIDPRPVDGEEAATAAACMPADEPAADAVDAVAPAVVAPAAVVPADAPPALSDPNGLVFVEVEGDGEVAIFQAGPVRYSVTLREDGITQRRVVIRANGKSCNHDLDLAVPAQRERTAGSVARQVGLPAATVSAHLVALLAAVQAHEAAAERVPTVAVAPAERAAAEAFLSAPDLLDRITADLTALGWIGEPSTKQLLYLASISRLLPSPVWAVYQATAGAAPWQGLGCIAALTPPESRIVFHRVTDAALTQADRASLRHRLLIVDQAETLRPEAALALRVLHERGGVGWASAATPAGTGSAPALLTDWRGPVAVLAAAVGHLDPRCRDCFLAATVDESPEQTARILADQRLRMGAAPIPAATHAAVIGRHHAAQRLLEQVPVVIPFVERISFPASRVRHRNEQAWLLGLIAASALLHQRQRQREDGAIVASEADFDIAVRCTAGLLGRSGDGISAAGRRLLDVITARRLSAFTMADIGGLFPDWSGYAYRAALQDLLDFGYLESPRGGRGRLRQFKLVLRSATALQAGDIRLRPVGSDPLGHADAANPYEQPATELAEVGGNRSANFTPVRTGT